MSNSYSPLERAIARVLARTPFIKQFAKNCYSRLVYLKHKKNYLLKSRIDVEKVVSSGAAETFFGYFDKSPVSDRGYTLVHMTDAPTDKQPTANVRLKLVVCDEKQNIILEAHSGTYNWQQGSRAHWLDDDKFIFNDFDEEQHTYISRVFSVAAGEEVNRFNFPVQDSFKNEYFLSLNYRRLMALRPDYGYRNLPASSEVELQDTESDGIWKIDMESGRAHLLLSIDDVKNILRKEEFENTNHKVNHLSISPSGESFIFLHRYYVGKCRVDRLMISSSDGRTVKVLSNYGMVSHCFWADPNTILGYLRGPNGKDAYWLININSGEFTHVADGKLDMYGDGHPHVVGDWFVTDTYPDKARMQYLLFCNWKTGEVKSLGEFFHGFNYNGETRCDLHPRLSSNGRYVYFDSVFDGKRHLYRMKTSI